MLQRCPPDNSGERGNIRSGRLSIDHGAYSTLKLEHSQMQLRTLAPELGQHRPPYGNGTRKKGRLRVKNGGSGLVRRPSGLPSIADTLRAAANRGFGPNPDPPRRLVRLSPRRVVAALVFDTILHVKTEVRRRLHWHSEQRVFGACHNLPMELC
jgi:hypothetical protein